MKNLQKQIRELELEMDLEQANVRQQQYLLSKNITPKIAGILVISSLILGFLAMRKSKPMSNLQRLTLLAVKAKRMQQNLKNFLP